jgi:hypothetical protein
MLLMQRSWQARWRGNGVRHVNGFGESNRFFATDSLQ